MSGISSTPERLYLLELGSTAVPTSNGTLDMVLGCYLIQMSDGSHILIDSGLPSDRPRPPGSQKSAFGATVIEQLAALGLRPDDISILICTHFDIDHVGYHEHFTKAELVVQRQHYELARGGHPRFAGGRSHWDHPDLRYRCIDGDTELRPGLLLIETSGHAPFHQSVLVHLPETGVVLLAIDAVVMSSLFSPTRRAWPMDDNEEQLIASTKKLLAIVDREHPALVVFGHDGRQWRTLKRAPEYYS